MNYIKSLYITFCAKISRYSPHIYFLQQDWTYFGLRALTDSGLGALAQFEPKKSDKKK